MSVQAADEERILVLAPTGRDTEMTRHILSGAGLSSLACAHIRTVCDELKKGAGVILITDETLSEPALQSLLRTFDEQEPWSDVPVIVFPGHAGNAAFLLERLGSRANVTILERPVRIAILVNAVRSALRARKRQYQTRDLLLQLEHADRQKDLFLAMLSHELRTPLNAILGWSRILQSGRADQETMKLGVEVINRSALAQAQLIADILSVSQIVAGTLRIEMEPVQLDVIVRAAIDNIRPAAEAKDIHIVLNSDLHASRISGDAGRLQQVMSNLLSNAIKFTPLGGRVEVELKSSESTAEIIVRDNGKGILPDFLPYVFDRFRQEDSTSTRSQGGLGLGLAIVRHLVELHHGSISADSRGEGQGSTFTVTLPISAAAMGPESERTEDTKHSLTGLHVLAVDDDRDSLVILVTVLEDHGAIVTAVTSAAEALEKIAKNKPDILVSDIGMPGQDGYQLLYDLSTTPAGRLIPAIALTGYASQQDRERAFEAGYRAHFAKPFEPDELVRSIESLVRRS
jgi:signal transduction histidine kinase/CheY-like chemotaxis protein